MATYKEIQAWVKARYGWLPRTCWIAHRKEMNGLPRRNAHNRQGLARLVPCPADKRDAIFTAFQQFGML